MKARLALGVVIVALVGSACATARTGTVTAAPAAPRYPDYPQPVIPAELNVSATLRTRHTNAWSQLQAGDLRSATREFNAILKEAPSFYPAGVGLGYVHLAGRDYGDAEPWFASAVAADDAYLPGWIGRAEALVALGRDAEAVSAMERVLALDPSLERVRTRLELLRFRLTQSALGEGLRARAAGSYEEAVGYLERALDQSPTSTMILGELARAEIGLRRFDRAEARARQAAQVEPRQAEWQALLGEVFEAQGRLKEAADAYGRADRLDPGGPWADRSREVADRALYEGLPDAFRAIPAAPSVTRADVAAFVGVRLAGVVERAPARVTTVATDVRTHWAAPWILPVTRAGIMTVFANHTFQPAAVVRRAELATTMAALLQLVGTTRPAELAVWRAARPVFADLPATHVSYPAAALAVAAGVMAADAAGRFDPTRPASGPELEQSVRRLEALTGR